MISVYFHFSCPFISCMFPSKVSHCTCLCGFGRAKMSRLKPISEMKFRATAICHRLQKITWETFGLRLDGTKILHIIIGETTVKFQSFLTFMRYFLSLISPLVSNSRPPPQKKRKQSRYNAEKCKQFSCWFNKWKQKKKKFWKCPSHPLFAHPISTGFNSIIWTFVRLSFSFPFLLPVAASNSPIWQRMKVSQTIVNHFLAIKCTNLVLSDLFAVLL